MIFVFYNLNKVYPRFKQDLNKNYEGILKITQEL